MTNPVHRAARKIAAYAMDSTSLTSLDAVNEEIQGLLSVGIGLDALIAPTLTNATGVPLEYLRNILPGLVRIITVPVLIDELIGNTTVGSWEDEEIVQLISEPTGTPRPYGDITNIPLSSFNISHERRTIVRFEEGLQVGKLEQARFAKMGLDAASEKRGAAAEALNISRNLVGFYGYNATMTRTYGLLNDPNLPAYVTVASGAGAGTPTEWSGKTFNEIVADIQEAIADLITRSGTRINEQTPMTLAVASESYIYLTTPTQYGNTPGDWLKNRFPNLRIVAVPQFNNANSGENVFYLWADAIPGSGTDNGRTFDQLVPSMFQLLGRETTAKTEVEDYTNATAGTLLKRPFAVVRRFGI
jgi:hypothetical protein